MTGKLWLSVALVVTVLVSAVAAGPGIGGIRTVTFAPGYVDRAGVTIIVRMEGHAGGEAWFGIQDVVVDRAMREVSRGAYEGSYRVRRGDHVENGAVVVRLRAGGRTWQERAERRITIRTGGVGDAGGVPRIDAPRAGSVVRDPIRIEGETRPNAVVEIRVSYPVHDNGRSRVQVSEIAVRADRAGDFRARLSIPLTRARIPVRLRAWAQVGERRSPAAVVAFEVER
jgi:hypothetical protein